MNELPIVREYENRILDILSSEDITEYFDEMLQIGARIISGALSPEGKKELAERLRRNMYFFPRETMADMLRHVAYLHLMVRLTESREYFMQLMHYIEGIRIEERYRFFLLMQTRYISYLKPQIISAESDRMFHNIYLRSKRYYADLVGNLGDFVKLRDRNCGQVVILTQQYLTDTHKETHLTNLIAQEVLVSMCQNVMIINTNDLLPVSNVVPLFGIEGHNSLQFLDNSNSVFIRGLSVPFFQCTGDMPSEKPLRVILSTIREMRPEYIISCGDHSITASLAAGIVPVIPGHEIAPNDDIQLIRENILEYRRMMEEKRFWQIRFRVQKGEKI
ncbi:hypothetical protein [Butyrivibrio sp. WCD3002]|uniref:hypothetical protein n=1 Tax=Butyrivibrio sp. WCD3002 TaxID=1280676 RepID=UPI0004142F59|nr:hypothetical protein [Butyrivibrio sp. WCD3002]